MLSAEALRRIDREIAKYPPDQKRSAVMSALTVAQDQYGWLPVEAMDEVAQHLGMPPVAVYEVATFYTMYNTEPTGRFKLTICTNLPCALSGAGVAAAHLKQRLGIDFNQTTADGKFTLKQGECFGACGDAPVVLVNNKRMVSFMRPDALDGLLDELSAAADRGEGAPAAGSVASEAKAE
jgi:NADH-quinone oxidoreductase subunit E